MQKLLDLENIKLFTLHTALKCWKAKSTLKIVHN